MASSCVIGGLDRVLGKVSSWKGLSSPGTVPRAVVERPSLKVFKGCVDVALRDAGYWWTAQCWVNSLV